VKIRIACLLFAAMLLALSACGTTQPANTPAATTGEEIEAVNYTTQERATEIKSTEETTTGIEEAAIEAPVGGSIAQVAAFYNQYASAVKAAERITIKKHNVRDAAMDIPAVIKALMPKRMKNFDPSANETITETFVNGRGTSDPARKLNDFLPVNGTSDVSRLKASHIKSASCAVQGEGWVVTINLKDEPMDMSSFGSVREDMSDAERKKMMTDYLSKSGYGSSMELGFGGGSSNNSQSDDEDDEDWQMPGNIDISSIKMDGSYRNGAITAVFDKEGRLTSLTLSYDNNMAVSVIGIKIKMDSAIKQDYQFTWQ